MQLKNEEKELTHIDLFSGIGGFTLAAEWAGFKTVVFCEKEKFCQKVLKKHWPEIPIVEEIRDFDGTKYQGTTLLTGGFPCQPFSVAGPRRGKEDDRYLWPEMLKVISEAKPRWILAENVPGIFRMALDTVLADLEGKDYSTGTFIIPACGLNAPHKRNRIWIVAHTRCQYGERTEDKEKLRSSISEKEDAPLFERSVKDDELGNAPHTTSQLRGTEQRPRQSKGNAGRKAIGNAWQIPWIKVATKFCRMDDGVSDRVHRLKALGNAIVPQVAYEILKDIAWIEKEVS